jgi:hypothetical protein
MRATVNRALRRSSAPPTGGWLRIPEGRSQDVAVKPAAYLPIYEHLLGEMRERAFTLLELGVWSGDSLEMWRDAFPRALIVGVDLQPPERDLGPRVHIVAGDQTDSELMQRIRGEHAPEGFDVIIDDASHIGVTSARSLQALFNSHLRAGGVYCVEDWGTGYVPSFFDGGRLQAALRVEDLDRASEPMSAEGGRPIPMPSHDIGMVGMVKRLVDHAAAGTVRWAQPELVGETLAIESMTVWDGIVALRKSAPAES